MLWERSDRPRLLVTESYLGFMGRQLCRPWIWLLFLCSFAAYLLFCWRGWLRNKIWWDIR